MIISISTLIALWLSLRGNPLPPTNIHSQIKDWAKTKANEAFGEHAPAKDERVGEQAPAKDERIPTYFAPGEDNPYQGKLLEDLPKAPPNWNATTTNSSTKSNESIPSATPSYSLDFPYKLWQTAPDLISQETWKYVQTWFTHNPSLRHEILTDRSADAFVVAKFAHRPDIVELYTQLNIKIAKFDMLRYLVLLSDGGVYADIDVSSDSPISEWVPPEYYGKVSLLIGQEFDYQWRGEGRELASQFTNWALMAKPGCKHLQLLIDEIVGMFQDLRKKHNCSYADLTVDTLGELGDGNIIDTTGPKHMSYAILRSLAQDLGTVVDDRNISDVESPRLIGDVLILPNVAFAAAQASYREDRGPIRLTHHYMGSWKRPEEDE